MNIPSAFYSPIPASFAGVTLLYWLALWSLLLIALLSAEWLWRSIWGMIEEPLGIKHPVTAIRMGTSLLLVSILMRIIPDVILFAGWIDLSPLWRWRIATFDKLLDTVSFLPFSLAWLSSHLGGPMVLFQLRRHPIPLHLWPTWQQAKRPLKIGVGVALMSFALVYGR